MHKQIKLAKEIAIKAHEGQVDKAGKAYILHPLAVSEKAEGDYRVKTAALLHDVLEDSSFTESDLLEAGIEKEIVEAVELLTHPDGEPYFDYVRRVKNNPISKAVKMADLKHNMDPGRIADPTEEDLERIRKYEKALLILSN